MKESVRLAIRLFLSGLLLALASSLAPGAVAAPSGGGFPVYFPLVNDVPPLRLPLILKQITRPLNLVNGSFEADTAIDFFDFPKAPCRYFGFTDSPKGNQHPSGWTFYSPAQGQALPYPTKMQQGNIVPAISGGPGEYVHKCWWQLPPNERLGQPRGLILDGDWTYKAFNLGNPQALVLSQVLSGTPGRKMEVIGFILGETPDHNSAGHLENDHFIGSVQLGGTLDKRLYATMITQHAVTGNERAWNKYDVFETIPDSGQLTLTIIMQQNWAGETDFFIDNFTAVEWLPS